jgi:hypothetical protein
MPGAFGTSNLGGPPLSPLGLTLKLMPCARRLVLSLVQYAERSAFFDQMLQPRSTEPAGLGFGIRRTDLSDTVSHAS